MWQDVTATRTVGVTYKNTGTKPIYVSVFFQTSSANAVFYIDGIVRAYFLGSSASDVETFNEIIPPGSTYLLHVSVPSGLSRLFWHELR